MIQTQKNCARAFASLNCASTPTARMYGGSIEHSMSFLNSSASHTLQTPRRQNARQNMPPSPLLPSSPNNNIQVENWRLYFPTCDLSTTMNYIIHQKISFILMINRQDVEHTLTLEIFHLLLLRKIDGNSSVNGVYYYFWGSISFITFIFSSLKSSIWQHSQKLFTHCGG